MSAGTSEFFCLICFLVCSCSAQTIIRAEVGKEVILPCKAPNNININNALVEWSRPELEPHFVLRYRQRTEDPDNQLPSYKNRVDLQDKEMKDRNISLILKNVRLFDNGKYKCRVFENGKKDSINIIKLEVLPSAQTNIRADLGQEVILPCKAPNINISHALVEWIRPELEPHFVLVYQDELFDSRNQHPSYKNRVDLQDKEMKDGNISLILKNVRLFDNGKFKCRVFEEGKIDSISIVNLEVLPSAQTNIRADLGQEVILPCKAPNNININNALVEWSRPELEPDFVLRYRQRTVDVDSQLPSYQNRVDLQDKEMKDGNVSLILKNVRLFDNGKYKCRVRENGKNDSISIIDLTVYLPVKDHQDQISETQRKVGLAVGLSLGVVVIVMLIFLWFYRKNQNRKIKYLEEANQQLRQETQL